MFLGIIVLCAGGYIQARTKSGDFGFALMAAGGLWAVVNFFLGRSKNNTE